MSNPKLNEPTGIEKEMEPPTIDVSGGDVQAIAKRIGQACERWGFFQIVGHGVTLEEFEQFDAVVQEFFSMAKEQKIKVKRKDVNPRGWFDDELTKRTLDYKECFDMGEEGKWEVDGENQWPDNFPRFREGVLQYYHRVEQVALRVAGLIALSLGLSENAFSKDLLPNTSFMRLNHYPVCSGTVKPVDETWNPDTEPNPEKDGFLSINKHTDAGVLTVLRQRINDPPSLQVLDREKNRFVRIFPTPGAFIINVGDVLQVWSNDRYLSPVHRVLASPANERYSVPFFLNPSYKAMCVPRLLGEGESSHYRGFSWGEFRRKRFEGDFADSGYDDVQISDYRIRTQTSRL